MRMTVAMAVNTCHMLRRSQRLCVMLGYLGAWPRQRLKMRVLISALVRAVHALWAVPAGQTLHAITSSQVRLKLETPLFVMEALLEAAGQLLANELATAEEEAHAVSTVR